MSFSIILTTCPNEEEADLLASKLVDQKLAACVQTSGIKSVYTWKGKKCIEPEIRLWIKTRTDMYDTVEKFILANHSYEVPQIVQIPFDTGYAPYLDWISEQT